MLTVRQAVTNEKGCGYFMTYSEEGFVYSSTNSDKKIYLLSENQWRRICFVCGSLPFRLPYFFFVCLPFVAASFGVCCRFICNSLLLYLPFVAALIADAERGGTRKDWGSGKLSKLGRYMLYDICCIWNTFYWIYLAGKRVSLFGSEAPLDYKENAVRRQ